MTRRIAVASGEDVGRRQARGHGDRECVQRGGDDAAQQPDACTACEREQSDRDVEEVPEPEARDLEGTNAMKTSRVDPDRGHDE